MFRKVFVRFAYLGVAFLVTSGTMNAGVNIFRPAVNYNVAGGSASSVVVADVNGDGKPDLVFSVRGNGNPGAVQILLGNGGGTFRTGAHYPTGSDANWLAVADVNGDTFPDVLVATKNGVTVMLGKGNGLFNPSVHYAISSLYGATSIAVSDVNGDSKPDLAVAFLCLPGFPNCDHGGGVTILLGNGDGTFKIGNTYLSGSDNAESIAIADTNRDGKPDVIVYNANYGPQSSVDVLLGNGDGTFQPPQNNVLGGYNGGTMALGDFNGDGIPDVAVVAACENGNCNQGYLGVMLGDGQGHFVTAKTYPPGGFAPYQVAIGDVNRDGIPDLVVTNSCDNSNTCAVIQESVLLGKGDGTFATALPRYSGGSPGSGYTGIAVADVNGDGAADAFVINNVGVGVLLTYFVTETAVASGPNPSVKGQPVTLTATVTTDGPIPPTGTVTFKSGGAVIGTSSVISGVATMTTSDLAVGSHVITASYAGDTLSNKSTSSAVIQVVNRTTGP